MRNIRITLGLALAVVCAFGALTAPAFAKKEKKAPVFGKFTASIAGRGISPAEPATAAGIGELDELSLAGGALFVRECVKDLKSSGTVVSESGETFFQNVKFSKCQALVKLGKSGLTSRMTVPKFTLGMEFHSNHSAVIGEEEENLRIVRPSAVSIKIGKTTCTVKIPAQTVPVKAEKKPTNEFEAAGYETIEEPVTKKKQLSKFPSGFQQTLDIEWEFKKLVSTVKPNENCKYPEGGGKLDTNPESPNFGNVIYNEGSFEGELEEITIKNGNVGFEPA
jgi:hypothetical protein